MAWARFSDDFDWAPPGAQWLTAYKAGMRIPVTRACLTAAVAAGKAVEVKAPSRRQRTGSDDA